MDILHVHFPGPLLDEARRAVLALVLPVVLVYVHMITKRVLPRVRLVAHVALVLSYRRVLLQMLLQIVFRRELLVAVNTFVLQLRVNPFVVVVPP